MAIFIVIGMVLGALALYIFLLFRRIRVRRSQTGAPRRSGMPSVAISPTSHGSRRRHPSLELWDRFLIYAIVFGIAEGGAAASPPPCPARAGTDILDLLVRQLRVPGGHTENAFAGLNSALSGAFSPPASTGGGGGFSGGAAVVAAVVVAAVAAPGSGVDEQTSLPV